MDAKSGAVKVTASPSPKKADEPQTFNLVISAGKTRETYDGLSLKKGDKNFVETMVNTKSKLVTVTVVATDSALVPAGDVTIDASAKKVNTAKVGLEDYQGQTAARTGLGGLEALPDVTMLIAPDLMSAYQNGELDLKGVQNVQTALIDYCERARYVFAILDAPPGLTQEVHEWRMTVNYDTSRAALYYPWID